MTRFRHVLAALAFAAVSLVSALPAHANSVWMCGAGVAGQGGSRQIGGATSAVPSGATYTLNPRSCALIAQADVGYFQSQGFSQPGFFQSFVFTTGVITSTTAVQITPSLPAGAFIRDILIENTTANAVTGGIDIGTTSGGADVVAAKTCAASCLAFVADAALLKRLFSKTATQPLFVVGHTDGNSANLNLTVVYGFF